MLRFWDGVCAPQGLVLACHLTDSFSGKKLLRIIFADVLQSFTVQPALSNAAPDQVNEVDILILSRRVLQRKPASRSMLKVIFRSMFVVQTD